MNIYILIVVTEVERRDCHCAIHELQLQQVEVYIIVPAGTSILKMMIAFYLTC